MEASRGNFGCLRAPEDSNSPLLPKIISHSDLQWTQLLLRVPVCPSVVNGFCFPMARRSDSPLSMVVFPHGHSSSQEAHPFAQGVPARMDGLLGRMKVHGEKLP